MQLAGVAEVSEILGVSKQRVIQLRSAGRLPPPLGVPKAGPIWDRAEIEAYRKREMPMAVLVPRDAHPRVSSGLGVHLVGSHLSAYRALRGEKSELAEWYVAGCWLIAKSDIPDHLVLAAHEIREVIEKLLWMVSAFVTTPELGNAVRELRKHWPKDALTRPDGDWPEHLMPAFTGFLREAQKLFAPDGEWKPRKETEMATYLWWRDPRPGSSGELEGEHRLRLGGRLRRYFVDVSHHRGDPTTIEEFEQHLLQFDAFVTDVLGPQTFGDFAAIDAIFEEVRNAN